MSTAPARLHPQLAPSRPAAGRHAIRRRRSRVGIALVAGLSLVATAALAGFLWSSITSPPCVPVRVVAAAEIAPFVERIARQVERPGCNPFVVRPRTSAVAAESLAIADGGEPPHVWIPESSLLLARARALGAVGVPESAPPVASSPVVMAMTEDAATRLGHRNAVQGWGDVLGVDGVTVGMPDPARDPVGLAALLEAKQISRAAPDPSLRISALLLSLAPAVAVQAADLYGMLPGTVDTERPVTAFPTSEQALLEYNVAHPDSPLTAAYPTLPTSSLDYPFAVLGTAGPDERENARLLLAALRAPAGQLMLADGGFRGPSGETLRDRSRDGRTLRTVQPPAPLTESAASGEVLQRWATVIRAARFQVLLDISGSMNAIVPELGKSRLTATLQAAEQGLRLFDPSSRLGAWVFSTNLDGDKDYLEVLPSTTVAALLAEERLAPLLAIRAKPDGDTGLYDSVLAAYQQARQNFDPGRLNLVIVMTDGNNDDPQGISKEELTVRLAQLVDPDRPVIIVGVAIGQDIDPTELDSIATPTGGGAFAVPDPSRITEVYLEVLSTLTQSP